MRRVVSSTPMRSRSPGTRKEIREGGPPRDARRRASPLLPPRLPGFEGPGRSLVPWRREPIGWRERDASTVCGKSGSLESLRLSSDELRQRLEHDPHVVSELPQPLRLRRGEPQRSDRASRRSRRPGAAQHPRTPRRAARRLHPRRRRLVSGSRGGAANEAASGGIPSDIGLGDRRFSNRLRCRVTTKKITPRYFRLECGEEMPVGKQKYDRWLKTKEVGVICPEHDKLERVVSARSPDAFRLFL
jgi:hypothetical protein